MTDAGCVPRLLLTLPLQRQVGIASTLKKLSKLCVREGVGPCGTFDDFLATPAGRRHRREGLEFIEAETQRLAPAARFAFTRLLEVVDVMLTLLSMRKKGECM
jgi:hypothetical protein